MIVVGNNGFSSELYYCLVRKICILLVYATFHSFYIPLEECKFENIVVGWNLAYEHVKSY